MAGDPSIDAFISCIRERMRDSGRVPRKLTIVIDLPEAPFGNEAAADLTHHLDAVDLADDPGRLGAILRALLRNPLHG